MNYARYFKTNQKVSLINISPERRLDLFESLTGIIAQCSEKHFDLSFPYLSHEGEIFPFQEGMYFKVTSETFGVGVQLSARFEGFEPDGTCRFSPTGNLELFQRRQIPRLDISLPLSTLSRAITPGDLHEEWQQMSVACQEEPCVGDQLNRQLLNVSAGGVRFEAEGEVKPADLHIVRMDLEDGETPLCAVTEVVWIRQEEEKVICGNRFIRILKSDQQRLVRLIVDRLDSQGKSVANFSSNWELLDRMIFSDV